jgi:hypothetical protein
VKKKLDSNVGRDFSAVITRGKRDIIDAPGLRGKNRVILDQTKNKYAEKQGLTLDAFARTLTNGGKVGGAWTDVKFLARADSETIRRSSRRTGSASRSLVHARVTTAASRP